VEDNAPESHDWCIDLWTVDECLPVVQRHFPSTLEFNLDTAERALILEYSPPLNSLSNPHSRALPRKYTERREARMAAAHRKAFSRQ
jgi:hypothetical protein